MIGGCVCCPFTVTSAAPRTMSLFYLRGNEFVGLTNRKNCDWPEIVRKETVYRQFMLPYYKTLPPFQMLFPRIRTNEVQIFIRPKYWVPNEAVDLCDACLL